MCAIHRELKWHFLKLIGAHFWSETLHVRNAIRIQFIFENSWKKMGVFLFSQKLLAHGQRSMMGKM